jgi:cellulose synthase/poly-beta-1,6-N-acetylglucosamine synthase-like glycosyltransferase
MKNISVVIPTYNEEGNVIALTKRIDAVLSRNDIAYELIFVDDNSKDDTQKLIKKLTDEYPIRLVVKPEGISKGKAFSLMLGFEHAHYDLIAMIDADLQYPPEAIPEMLEKIENGAGVVVANRVDQKTTFARKFTNWGFRTFFAKFLHGFDCDVQSGLKVFKKEIIERVTINPSQWTFDMEFLSQARDGGYPIETVSIVFAEREAGTSNINALKASYEIGMHALKLKLRESGVVPLHSSTIEKEGIGYHYKGKKFVHHSGLHFSESAVFTFTFKQKVALILLAVSIVVGLILNLHTTLVVVIAVLTVLYFCDLFFNFYLIYRNFSKSPEIQIDEKEIDAYSDEYWPMYSIFCPLYKEWEVLPQFVSAMSKLNYPKNKMHVMLLLEEDDQETVQKAREFNLPEYFEIVVVPHSKPKTKPKACNYGLMKAKGEFIVIYDAEDVPDAYQLKKAVLAFERVPSNVKCIQAKLNYYNPHQNLLTRMFTAEYSLWFDLVLTGLQSIDSLIPLGGTSNHFRRQDLIDMNGWDAFNVTEDCDLGIRMVKRGYRTALIESTTLEEANSDVKNWIYQRSRWIKGYMVSYFVHMRHPGSFIRDKQWQHLIALQINVGGKILSMFINPLMWVITITYFAFRTFAGPYIQSLFPTAIFYMAVLCLVVGNFMYVYYYMIGCAKREHFSIVKYVYFVPFYWLLMSVAAWLALYKLIVAPHHWAKTKHGLHLKNQKAMAQAESTIGRSLVEEQLIGGLAPAVVSE